MGLNEPPLQDAQTIEETDGKNPLFHSLPYTTNEIKNIQNEKQVKKIRPSSEAEGARIT